MLPQGNFADAIALPDGDLVLAGTIGTATLAIAELRSDGRLDQSFGIGGVKLLASRLLPWQLLALPDGKLLIVGPNRPPANESGAVRRVNDWQILRLSAHGVPDPSFGRDGMLDVSGVPVGGLGPGSQVTPQLTTGERLILPTFVGQSSATGAPVLVRLNADGSKDPSFGSAGALELATLFAYWVRPDGSIIAATREPPIVGSKLVGFTADGRLDPGFNGGAPLQLPFYAMDDLLVTADGGIEALGNAAPPSSQEWVWHYTASGAVDSSWGNGGSLALPPGPRYSRLLPGGTGATLVTTAGPLGDLPGLEGAPPLLILSATAGGQLDPTLGGGNGVTVTLPFGGGVFAPGTIANLRQNSFRTNGIIPRPGGGLVVGGSVQASEAIFSEGGEETPASISGLGLAALDSSFQPDRSFTGGTRQRVSLRLTSTRLTRRGVSVKISSADGALAVVTVTGAGRILGKTTVRFFGRERPLTRRTVTVPLTHAGLHLLSRRRMHVTVTVAVADLAGNHTTVRTSATLAR